MKSFLSILSQFRETRGVGIQNFRFLVRFLVLLIGMVLAYSLVFHVLMIREGQVHSLFTGIYWTLTVMSTLGFGEIVFVTDLGRAFSMLVLCTGVIVLLVILPFTFLEFFYIPWMARQQAARTPRELPFDTKGHVIMTNYDSVTAALILKFKQHHTPYALVVPDPEKAMGFHERGIRVVVGDLDVPETYFRLQIEKAAMVVATADDILNTKVAFTVRDMCKSVPIVCSSDIEASVDILELAGCTHVVQIGELVGQFLARRATGGDAVAHVIGRFDDLYIADATVNGTPLVGKALADCGLREMIGVSIVGVWERGKFISPSLDIQIHPETVLVMAGSKEQIEAYDEMFCIYHRAGTPVVIIGAGRVGLATARALAERDVDFRIVDQEEIHTPYPDKFIRGNAAELEVLETAGIREAHTVIITTSLDDSNTYLTIYCRKLRPDIQLISRATLERNVAGLHRAGADFVMSYAAMGSNIIFNLLKHSDLLLIAEGLSLFHVKLPDSLAGKTLVETGIRDQTGCSVVAVSKGDQQDINPEPSTILESNSSLILIGSVEAENRFLKLFVPRD